MKLEADIKKKKISTRESEKKPGAKNDITKKVQLNLKNQKINDFCNNYYVFIYCMCKKHMYLIKLLIK